jgi:hypothetical protein
MRRVVVSIAEILERLGMCCSIMEISGRKTCSSGPRMANKMGKTREWVEETSLVVKKKRMIDVLGWATGSSSKVCTRGCRSNCGRKAQKVVGSKQLVNKDYKHICEVSWPI